MDTPESPEDQALWDNIRTLIAQSKTDPRHTATTVTRQYWRMGKRQMYSYVRHRQHSPNFNPSKPQQFLGLEIEWALDPDLIQLVSLHAQHP